MDLREEGAISYFLGITGKNEMVVCVYMCGDEFKENFQIGFWGAKSRSSLLLGTIIGLTISKWRPFKMFKEGHFLNE